MIRETKLRRKKKRTKILYTGQKTIITQETATLNYFRGNQS